MMNKLRLPILLTVAAFISCSANRDAPSGPIVPVDDGSYVLTIIPSASLTDSIQGLQSLGVRVTRADGTPRADSPVVFSAINTDEYTVPTISLIGANDTTRSLVSAVTTNSDGKAFVTVVHGTVDRKERVRIVSVAGQLTQFLDYTSTPGMPDHVVLSPTDTIATPGQTVKFSGQSVDRFGNKRTDSVTFTLIGDVASISSTGTATALKTGVQVVNASVTVGGKTAYGSGHLFVPPASSIIWSPAQTSGRSSNNGVVQGNLSSTLSTPLLSSPANYAIPVPGSVRALAYVADSIIVIRYADGSETRYPVGGSVQPKISIAPDGSALYFTKVTPHAGNAIFQIYRTPISTFAPELVTGSDTAASAPAISPDGKKMAFTSSFQRFEILDLSTGVLTTPIVPNGIFFPEWSPDGEQIAYIKATSGVGGSGPLGVYNVKSGSESVIGTVWSPNSTLAWSPDSHWLIAWKPSNNSPGLVHVGDWLQYRLSWIGANPIWHD